MNIGTKKRILHVIPALPTGGAETMLLKLMENVDQSIWDVAVLSLRDKGTIGPHIEKLGIPVHTLNMRPGIPRLYDLVKLVISARNLKTDILQGWMYHGNVAATMLRHLMMGNVPVVWNVRHCLYDLSHEKNNTARLIKATARLPFRPHSIIYNSRLSAMQHEAIGYSPTLRSVIPNGFDCQRFSPSLEARNRYRHEMGLDSQSQIVGMVARYHPIKGHANFLEAAARVSSENNTAHFVMIGKGVDSENQLLAKMVSDLGLSKRVHMLGERSDTPALTSAFDVAVSASESEGFSNTIGEAMACGVPCVVTNAGDSAWLVGDTGKVVPRNDPHVLGEALKTMLAMGDKQRQELGKAARQRILDEYTIEKISRQYMHVYHSLFDGKETF
ncbi:MAG: glycosyltransferase [Gammaproteobacteria bacterium]|nr:glycosyltransferase [Gammaproteobacteria bacterium]